MLNFECLVLSDQKDLFFFLAQSELGDLYKVTLDYEDDVVSKVSQRRISSLISSCF